jgi:NADH dehydrogenase
MVGVAKNHRVVVVGGGFGGLYETQCLKNLPVAVTLIDRRGWLKKDTDIFRS